MARPIAREAAMQLVFEQLFGGEATAETLVDLIDYKPGEKDSTYIDTVVSGVKEHAEQLDGEIAACLRGWTLARLSRVDLAALPCTKCSTAACRRRWRSTRRLN